MSTQAEQAMALSAILQRYPDLPALLWSIGVCDLMSGMVGGRSDKEHVISVWADRFNAALIRKRMVKGGIEITTRFAYGDVPVQVWTHLWEETA